MNASHVLQIDLSTPRHAGVNERAEAVPRGPALNRRFFLVFVLLPLGLAGLATALQGAALWDVEAVRVFQGNGALRLPMVAITTLGSEGFFLLLALLVFWCIDKPLGMDIALLLTLTGAANLTLKVLLQGPRPFWSDPALMLAAAASFSTPSGHAAHATALFGYLAWWLAGRQPRQWRSKEGQFNPQSAIRSPQSRQVSPLRELAAVLSVLCIFLVCLSRVYLGVHYPGDVVWGCAEGIVVLLAYIGLKPRAAAWLAGRSLGTHIVLAAGTAAVLLALNMLFLAGQPRNPLGAAHPFLDAGTRAQAMNEAANLAGLVLGTWVGLALELRYVRFTTSGTVVHRALRYGLGLAGLLLIWLLLGLPLPGGLNAIAAAPAVAGAAAAALWALFAGPWLFVRVGLANPERSSDAAGRAG
jgi:membrane-associated phospholipid phosphatase